MKNPRLLTLALATAFVFGYVPTTTAIPFVFPDRADILYTFPDWTLDDLNWSPDGILFVKNSIFPGIGSGSGGGYGSGSGGGGGGWGNTGEQTVADPFGSEALPFGFDPNAFLPGDGNPTTSAGGGTSSFNQSGGSGSFDDSPLGTIPTSTGLYGLTLGEEIDISERSDPPTSPAPEPASLLLLGAGAAGLVVRHYRQHRTLSRYR